MVACVADVILSQLVTSAKQPRGSCSTPQTDLMNQLSEGRLDYPSTRTNHGAYSILVHRRRLEERGDGRTEERRRQRQTPKAVPFGTLFYRSLRKICFLLNVANHEVGDHKTSMRSKVVFAVVVVVIA